MIYRPPAAAAGNFQFSIDGPIELGRGERLNVPDIGLLQTDQCERWFLLPGQSQGRNIRWQTRGLKPSSWPSFAAASSDPSMAAYMVSGEPVHAVLMAAETPVGSAFVRLADLTVLWRPDGSCCGTATFDLEPGGAGECPLRLPKGHELIQISVEGMPVTPKMIAAGDWRFALASQRLPQRVGVIFRDKVPLEDRTGRARSWLQHSATCRCDRPFGPCSDHLRGRPASRPMWRQSRRGRRICCV